MIAHDKFPEALPWPDLCYSWGIAADVFLIPEALLLSGEGDEASIVSGSLLLANSKHKNEN